MKYSNLVDFLDGMNPMAQDIYGRDEQRAFSCDAPWLCTIDAAYGDGASLIWLVKHITDLNHKIGVKIKMDDLQMIDFAQKIRNGFGDYKASEIMLFFYKVKDGQYGKFYGIVDPQLILDALRNKFAKERADAIDKMEKEQKWKEREQWAKTALKPDEIKKLFEELERKEKENERT